MKATGVHPFLKVSGGVAGLGLLVVVLVAANIVLGQLRLRADLTEEKLYTLSEGSQRLVKALEEPVTLKLFFSRSAPEVPVQLKAYATQVEDLLREYRLASNGRVVIELHDPKPDSEAEEWAQSFGLTPQSMDLFGQPVYFGLVASAGGNEGALPALDPRTDRLLEYNITRLIYRVTHPKLPVVGVMSSLPVLGQASAPAWGAPAPPEVPRWLAFQEIQQDYDLRPVEPTATEIPADIQALVLVHPQRVAPATAYALDQFVLRGGQLLVLMDPMNVADLEAQSQAAFMGGGGATGLEPLLSAWNVSYNPDQIVADLKAVSRLRGAGNRVEESPVFLSLTAENVNRDDVLTAQLGTLMLPFSGAFEATDTEQLKVTPLLTSSDMAGRISAMTARFGGEAVNREFSPQPVPLHMAIRLSGTFTTAFPDGAPAAAEGEAPPPPATPPLREGRSSVILVGDADLIFDRFCVEEMNFFGARALQPLNDNLHFFANAVEQIAGSADLVGIRSRGDFFRPFDRVVALEAVARRAWQEQEQALMRKLEDTRQQLSQMQTQKDAGQQFILSPAQKETIARFREQEVSISRQLKEVRKDLRREIEQLGLRVKLANIVLMPALVTLGGLAYGLRRRRR